jgi:hypothetical protein
MSNDIKRTVGNIDYVANQKKTFDLPTDNFINKLYLSLTGSVNTGATVPSLNPNNPLGIIKNIEVIAEGSGVIKHYNAEDLFLMDIYEYGTRPELTHTTTAANQTNSTFEASLSIDFDSRDFETLLPAFQLGTLTLAITWGNDTDLATHTSINEATVAITTHEIIDGESEGIYKEQTIIKNIPSASTHRIDLPRGNLYEGLFIHALERGGVSSDFLVENIEIKLNGTQQIRDFSWSEIRRENKLDMGLETLPTGTVYIDFIENINTEQTEVTKFEIFAKTKSPTGESEIRVITQELIIDFVDDDIDDYDDDDDY